MIYYFMVFIKLKHQKNFVLLVINEVSSGQRKREKVDLRRTDGAWACVPSPETVTLKIKVSVCVSPSILTASVLPELWPVTSSGVSVTGVKAQRFGRSGEVKMSVVLVPGGGGYVRSAAAGFSRWEAEVPSTLPSSAQTSGRWRLRQPYVAGFRFFEFVCFVSSLGYGHGAEEVLGLWSLGLRSFAVGWDLKGLWAPAKQGFQCFWYGGSVRRRRSGLVGTTRGALTVRISTRVSLQPPRRTRTRACRCWVRGFGLCAVLAYWASVFGWFC